MAALATLQDVKDWLDITSSTHDDILQTILDSVCASVMEYCEQTFALVGPIVEVNDGNRSDQIVTREFPIVSVDEIKVDVNPDGSEGTVVDSDTYQVLPEAILLQTRITPRGRSVVAVTYTHGYASVPAPVHMAVLLSVEALFRRKGRKSIGTNSRSKKDERESFSTGPGAWDAKTGLPKEAVFMLNPYKRFEVPVQPMAQRNL